MSSTERATKVIVDVEGHPLASLLRLFLLAVVSAIIFCSGCSGADGGEGAGDVVDAGQAEVGGGDAALDAAASDGEFPRDDTGAHRDVDADVEGEHDGGPDASDAGRPPSGWSLRAPLGEGPRQEHAVVALGGFVYALGGIGAGLAELDSVERYDPTRDRWESVASLPVPMHHVNAVVHDGAIYVLGFLRGLGFEPDGRCYRFDPAGDAWQEIASMPEGRERGASVMGSLADGIVVAGGLRGRGAVNDVSWFDPESATWSELPDLPTPGDHLAGGVIDGRLYVAGGRRARTRAHTDQLVMYEVDAEGWRVLESMPTSRAGAASAVTGGHLFVFGGEGNPDDPDGMFHVVEAYDPNADAWTSLGEMPTPRHGTGAAAVDGVIYIPGGADVEAFGAIESHAAFVP